LVISFISTRITCTRTALHEIEGHDLYLLTHVFINYNMQELRSVDLFLLLLLISQSPSSGATHYYKMGFLQASAVTIPQTFICRAVA
jgi:hypothetical protein